MNTEHVPWRHVLRIGLETAVLFSILQILVNALVTALGLGAVFLVLAFGSLSNMTMLALFTTVYILYRSLSGLGVREAFMTAFLTGLMIGTIHQLVSRSASVFDLMLKGYEPTVMQVLSQNPVGYFLIIGAGVTVILCVSFYVLNVLQTRKVHRMVYISASLMLLVGMFVFASLRPVNDKIFEKNTADNSWAVYPTYLPAGVSDGPTKGPKCKDSSSNANSYECEYWLYKKDVYLAPATIAELDRYNSGRDDDAPLAKLFTVQVRAKDHVSEVVLFSDGKCSASSVYLGMDNPELNRQCKSIKTPKGKTVYYNDDIRRVNGKMPATNYYYFVEGAAVVALLHISNFAVEGNYHWIIHQDPNSQTELLKFIDGFEPLNKT